MKDYDKFTTVSNSVDTRGICWLFGYGYFNDQSANKRQIKAETWSLRFDLLTIKMCIWDYKSSRLVLRCWCLTSINHEVVCGNDREIFVTIIEGSLQFDLILLQLWNKITLSSRWPPSFKSLQITSSFLSLCGHLGHKALKNVPASGLSWFMLTKVFLSYLKTNFTLKCLQTSLTCISLCQKCCDPSIFIS